MGEIPKIFITGPCGRAVYMSVIDFHKLSDTAIESDKALIEPGGGGLIRGIAAKRLGAFTSLLTALNPDDTAARFALKSEGVEAVSTLCPNHNSFVKSVLADKFMNIRETVYKGDAPLISTRDILENESSIRLCNTFLTDGFMQEDALYLALEIVKRAGGKTILIPDMGTVPNAEVLNKVWLLILSINAAKSVLGIGAGAGTSDITFSLMRMGIKRAAVLLSEKQLMIFDNDEVNIIRFSPSGPISLAGALDVFAAAAAVQISAGYSFPLAVRHGIAAISVNSEKDGVLSSLPYKKQLGMR